MFRPVFWANIESIKVWRTTVVQIVQIIHTNAKLKKCPVSTYHPDINRKGLRKTSGHPVNQPRLILPLIQPAHVHLAAHCKVRLLSLSDWSAAYIVRRSCMLTIPPPSLRVQLPWLSCWLYHCFLCSFRCHKLHADDSTAFFPCSVLNTFTPATPPPSLNLRMYRCNAFHAGRTTAFLARSAVKLFYDDQCPPPLHFSNKTAKTALVELMLCKG
jgi:hypothetical protein